MVETNERRIRSLNFKYKQVRNRGRRSRGRRRRIHKQRKDLWDSVVCTCSCQCKDPVPDRELPMTRGECPKQRPCPYVTCRHHLWSDTDDSSVVIAYPVGPLELRETCSLDIADRGCTKISFVGDHMNMTNQGVIQMIRRIKEKLTSQGFADNDITDILRGR